MDCLSVKDDQQQVWQNLSLSRSLLTAQLCYEALLPALVFYSLLHGSFLLPADSTRDMKLSTIHWCKLKNAWACPLLVM